jgi:hypothetical protein
MFTHYNYGYTNVILILMAIILNIIMAIMAIIINITIIVNVHNSSKH